MQVRRVAVRDKNVPTIGARMTTEPSGHCAEAAGGAALPRRPPRICSGSLEGGRSRSGRTRLTVAQFEFYVADLQAEL